MVLKDKGIIQEFDLVVYPIGVVLVIGILTEEVNRLYKPYDEKYNWIAPSECEDTPMSTYLVRNKKTGNCCCLIWAYNPEEFRGSYLCHEAGHAAQEIFKYIGAKADFNNQEPLCYLLGSIFRLCNNAYWHWKDFVDSKTKNKKNKTCKTTVTQE